MRYDVPVAGGIDAIPPLERNLQHPNQQDEAILAGDRRRPAGPRTTTCSVPRPCSVRC